MRQRAGRASSIWQSLFIIIVLLLLQGAGLSPVHAQPAQEGDVRLVGGSDALEGRVEIYHEGQWGTVCDDRWGRRDAEVVCRQLGYSGGRGYRRAQFGQGSGPIWLDNVRCDGSEDQLAACGSRGWGVHDCFHHEDAGVSCDASQPLPPGEVNQAPVFTTAAAQNVAENSAGVGTLAATDANDDVVTFAISGGVDAGQFVLNGAWLAFVTAPDFESPTDVDDPSTTGTDEAGDNRYLVTVTAADGRGGTATLALVVTVTDVGEPGVQAGDVRLVGGSHALEGRVEIYHEGQWGTVCDDSWGTRDAEVVCRQLGYGGGTSYGVAQFGRGSGRIWLDDVYCYGHESRLADCSSRGWGVHNCLHHEDAGVSCDASQPPAPLPPGEVNQAPVFTTAATQNVAENRAGVVTLAATDANDDPVTFAISGGVDAGQFALNGAHLTFIPIPDFESPTDVDDPSTTGTDEAADNQYLVTVTAADGRGGTATLALVVTVTDVGEPEVQVGAVRLRGGSHALEGRVEIYQDGQWGTVCDDRWDTLDAKVVCRQLGYSGGTSYGAAQFGQGSGRIWLDNVYCDGSESRLADCSSRGWGVHNCLHHEDAGVSCDASEPPAPFPPGEVNQAPVFTTAAARNVAENRVRVVTLAATDANDDPVTFTISGGVDAGQFALNGARLAFVTAPDFESPTDVDDPSTGETNEAADNRYLVTVAAADGRGGTATLALVVTVTDVGEPEVQAGAVRLRGGSHALEGRVEIYHEGRWGTVCDDSWGTRDAKVVCRQLGHRGGTSYGAAQFGRGSGRIWLDDVYCFGHESRLADCSSRGWGVHNCIHYEDAGVSCDASQPPLAAMSPAAPLMVQPIEPATASTESESPFAAISSGEAHTCALTEAGEAVCWGDDLEGQATPGAGFFVALSSGGAHTCALTEAGEAVCWGDDLEGQATPGAGFFVALSSGGAHTCALTEAGEAVCWGDDLEGQATPGAGFFVALSSGGRHTCALTEAGEAVCWGDDTDGQATPMEGPFSTISSGEVHTCALTEAGEAVCWGDDLEGQATPGAGPFSTISSGRRHTCALTEAGEAMCWGADTDGQATPMEGPFVALSSGEAHTCALTEAGEAVCWGDDTAGQGTPPE